MAITDGVVSLKHLVTMETLSNEEVLGLIKRGIAFKNNEADNILQLIYSLNHQHVHTNLSKSQKENLV